MLADETTVCDPGIVVLGVGNAYRRDDGVGVFVARRVSREVGDAVAICDDIRDSADLIENWADAGMAYVVDAVSSGARPGTIFQLEVGNQPIPESLFHYSTHNLSISEAIELGRAIGRLPARLVICGIEGANFDMGTGLSPEVQEAAEWVVRLIVEKVRAATGVAHLQGK
jgi:hydrogenase maturation protease